MANFDIILVYSEREAGEFQKQRLPHPKVRKGNKMPTTGDVLWALDSLENAHYDRLQVYDDDELRVDDTEARYSIAICDFDWNDQASIPGDYFSIRGRGPLCLAILIKLCEIAGQLVLWPDTGEPPIVLDASMDANLIDELHREDSWELFFAKMYGKRSSEIFISNTSPSF